MYSYFGLHVDFTDDFRSVAHREWAVVCGGQLMLRVRRWVLKIAYHRVHMTAATIRFSKYGFLVRMSPIR